MNNSCIVWNYRGDFYDLQNTVEISLLFNKPSHFHPIKDDEEPDIFIILDDVSNVKVKGILFSAFLRPHTIFYKHHL